MERSVVDPIHKAAGILSAALEELGEALDEETVKILRKKVKNNPTINSVLDFIDGKKPLTFSGLERLARNLNETIPGLYGKGEG